MNEPELKDALNKFEKLLQDHSDDDLKSVVTFKSFIRNFLRVRTNSVVLPTSEVMTILKHEKPNIFFHLRKNFQSEPLFDLLTQLEVDYHKAVVTLDKINKGIQ
jgi:hypothetical protein